MIGRAVALSVLAMLVAGCAAIRTGSDFTSLSQGLGPPKAGQARVVVFRERTYTGLIDQGWEVKLDGEKLHDLKTETYVYADKPAGRHRLSSSSWGFPGETQYDITLAPGRTHFFVAKLSDRARTLNTMTAFAGLSGLVVGAAVTSGDSNPGPIDFIPLEEGAARAAIAELHLAE